MYEIEYSEDAVADLVHFRKFEQVEITDAVEQHLTFEPTVPSRRRKQLRPNRTSNWELRIGNFRVFYNAVEMVRIVAVVRIGEKRGNMLFFRGKRGEI